MRVIDIGKPEQIQRVTVLSYGMSRSGKTRWAASFVRPLFFSDATESGWTTIANMSRDAWFEKNHEPMVWAIENSADMIKAVQQAEPLIRSGKVRTIVIDSLTFYADLYFNALDSAHNGRADARQLYQKLGQHLKNLREQIHLLGCNVVWLALEKPPGDDSPIGGPMLSGQNAAKFAAGCDYVLYHRSFQSANNGPLQFEIRTKKFGAYQAGGRDEGLLSDPLGYMSVDDESGKEIFITDCTYRTFAETLNIANNLSKPFVPAFTAPPAPTAPIVQAVVQPTPPTQNNTTSKTQPKSPSVQRR